MTSIQNRRANVLAEAVVSNYINELSPRERPAPRPAPERTLARVARRRRSLERPRLRPALVEA
jgi:hypothetical protein